MKKIIVVVLAIVVCLGAVGVMSGCGGDNEALLQKISELEQQVANNKGEKGDKGDKGDKGEDGGATPANKIYSIGDEVTVSNRWYDLFKVRLDRSYIEGSATVMTVFTVTNINMATRCAGYIVVSYIRADGTFFKSNYPNDSTKVIAQGQSDTFLCQTNFDLSLTPPDKIYLGFPNAEYAPFIPYAIFQIS